MQATNSMNEEALKNSIPVCTYFAKGYCKYDKSCKFRHPVKLKKYVSAVDTKWSGNEAEVCRNFMQNNCRRGQDCRYLHVKPKASKKKQRSDWLTFCLYYPTGLCKNIDCRFLHVTQNDRDTFCNTGEVGFHIVEQAMCKALCQDVSFNGNAPICKDYLQGHCEWMSCPYLHLARKAYTEAITGALLEKFESAFGPQSYIPSGGACYQAPSRPYNPVGYDSLSLRTGSVKSSFASNDCVGLESDKIIKGIYSLMKEDLNRNPERHEISDLREKLNLEVREDLKYQEMILRLEQENLKMKRDLIVLQEQKQDPYYMGKQASSYMGRDILTQDHRRVGTVRGGENYKLSANFRTSIPMTNHKYNNQRKQEVQNQLRENMAFQYSYPKQKHHTGAQYIKKIHQNNQQTKKNFQQTNKQQKQVFKETQSLKKKSVKTPNLTKKKPETKVPTSSDQDKLETPKIVPERRSNVEENVPQSSQQENSETPKVMPENKENAPQASDSLKAPNNEQYKEDINSEDECDDKSSKEDKLSLGQVNEEKEKMEKSNIEGKNSEKETKQGNDYSPEQGKPDEEGNESWAKMAEESF